MTDTLRVYHNARCSKSRSACQLLEERGLAFEVVEYLKTPPSRDELAAVDGVDVADPTLTNTDDDVGGIAVTTPAGTTTSASRATCTTGWGTS